MNEVCLFLMKCIHPGLFPSAVVKWLNSKISFKLNNKLSKYEQNKKRTICYSSPRVMEIWSTTVCNINPPCVMCFKHNDPEYLANSNHLPRNYIEKIKNFTKKSHIISLHGGGEPLTCKDLFEPIKNISENTKVCFVSNGLLLNEEHINKILENNIYYIEFSIDAATPEMYYKIRHNNLDTVKSNIRKLVEKRDALGLMYPNVHINMCVMRENMREIPDFVRMGKMLGAVSVHLVHLNKGSDFKYGWFDYKNQHCDLEPEVHDHFMKLGFKIAKELNIELRVTGKKYLCKNDEVSNADTLTSSSNATKKFYCDKPWTRLLIATDGSVRNCCYQNKPIGNLEISSINDVWNAKVLQEIRAVTAHGQPHSNCVNANGGNCPELGKI